MKIPSLINTIEGLHRLFLELLKVELLRRDIKDINSVQSMILYNIGRDQVSIGDLEKHGYYHGANVTYNLRAMVQNGYVLQEINPDDLRSSHISLSAKGIKLFEDLDKLFKLHEEELKNGRVNSAKLVRCYDILKHFEKYLNNLLRI